ncbi:MAG: ferredoxin [Pseudomonadota bacterium]
MLLLGPAPDFWPHFTQSPEWLDGKPDAMDRWSTRVLNRLADDMGGEAMFPFGGEPFLPFFSWALKSGQAWQSPVNLLVHAQAGLMVSYRGALALPYEIDLPPAAEKPCDTCDKPCLSACNAGALTGDGYDVPACKSFLTTEKGRENMALGCNVRRACPVSQSYARMSEQSAYHMRVFMGENR